MPKPKLGTNSKGEPTHYSVGALITKEEDGQTKYFLIKRTVPPPGFAGIAGHVDEGETPEQALVREVREESGLTVTDHKLLYEEELTDNWCVMEFTNHHWWLYRCEVEGQPQTTKEASHVGWHTVEQIKQLDIEGVWQHWFRRLGILPENQANQNF